MKLKLLLGTVLLLNSAPTLAQEFSFEWDWQLSASDTSHQNSPLMATPTSATSQNIDGLLDVQVDGYGITGLLAVKGTHLYSSESSQERDSELVVQELFWQGSPDLSDFYVDITLGKMRIDWGVGYGYRPLDLFKPYRRNPVGIQVEEGAGVAMLSYFDELGEWSVIYSDSSWTSQQSSDIEQASEQQGVGVRRYLLEGDSEYQWIAYYDDVRKGLLGGSVVSVLNSSWAVHASAVYQRNYYAYQQSAHFAPVELTEQDDGVQTLVGLNWANEVGNNVIIEYWYDNRSWDKTNWDQAFERVEQLSSVPSTYPLSLSYANGLNHANLVAHNFMLHWSLNSSSWNQWDWSKDSLWLSKLTPTFDLLYSPQDGGVIATQWLDFSAYDSGYSSVNLEVAARFFTGSDSAVYANLGDKRMIFINLKGRF